MRARDRESTTPGEELPSFDSDKGHPLSRGLVAGEDKVEVFQSQAATPRLEKRGRVGLLLACFPEEKRTIPLRRPHKDVLAGNGHRSGVERTAILDLDNQGAGSPVGVVILRRGAESLCNGDELVSAARVATDTVDRRPFRGCGG